MESTSQSQPEISSATIRTEAITDKPKSSKGMLIGMIICAVLAVGGVGFGAYGIIQEDQAKEQIADLKAKITQEDGTATTIENNTTKENTPIAEETNTLSYATYADHVINSMSGKVAIISVAKVTAKIDGKDNNHLTIKDREETITVEDDEVLSVIHLNGIGNGAVDYFYYIKRDGSVVEVQISEGIGFGEMRTIEGLSEIVTVIDGSGYYPRFIDIHGNYYYQPCTGGESPADLQCETHQITDTQY